MSGIPGMNEGKKLTPAVKDAIAAGMIESIMDARAGKTATCFECGKSFKPKKLSTQDVNLLKIRYDKLRPSLSTIEQRNVDPGEKMTDGQIIVQLHSLITSSPTVLGTLLGLLVKADRGAVERALVAEQPGAVIDGSSAVDAEQHEPSVRTAPSEHGLYDQKST